MAGKAKITPDTWLGNYCKVCGAPIRGRRKVYCGENCRKIANNKYCRDYYHRHKNKQKSTKKKQQKKPGTALRVPCQGQQARGCTVAGQPSVSDVGSSLPPFPEKKTRAGGVLSKQTDIPMYCEKYRQIITADICAQRQDRRKGGAEFLDVFCRHTCLGEMLRPATDKEISRHRSLIRRVARERNKEASPWI